MALSLISQQVYSDEAINAMDFWMRVEAEDMKLFNYSEDLQTEASGESVIATQGNGEASTKFTGASGVYDLVVGYQDQAGYIAGMTLLINGTEYAFQLDGISGAGIYQVAGVTLETDDVITLKGSRDGDDLARIDYLDILTAGSTSENVYAVVSNESNGLIRIEAESLELGGGYIQSADANASGDSVIVNTTWDTGTAKYTHTGVAGIFDLHVNYFDNSDGNSTGYVWLNGEFLNSWKFSDNDNSTHERLLGIDLSLNQGDIIEFQTWNNKSEQSIIDYFVLEDKSLSKPEGDTAETIRVQSENMSLSGQFSTLNEMTASGGVLVQTGNTSTGLTAVTDFTGKSGIYDIIVGYYDRAGSARYTVNVEGQQLDSWLGTLDFSGKLSGAATTHTLSGVLLNQGDTFSLQSIADGKKDNGYIDFVEFVPIALTENNLPEGSLQLEVETFDLAGDVSIQNADFASGNSYVSTTTAGSGDVTFTATNLFTGSSGYYDVVLGYYDNSDGEAELSVSIDNQQLDNWYSDQNLGATEPSLQNFTTRTVATGLYIDETNLIEITGIKHSSDKVNVDYIQFIAVDAPSQITDSNSNALLTPNADILRGGAGSDNLWGGLGDDFLYGETESDIDGSGDDYLQGDEGNDMLFGNSGNDILLGTRVVGK